MRPHLQNIDNVPLLVPLFTDCTPESKWHRAWVCPTAARQYLSHPFALAHLGVDRSEGKRIQYRNLEVHFDINDPLLLSVGSQVLTLF